MSTYAEIHPQRILRVGRYHWKGRRRFSCADAYAGTLENMLYGGVFPGYSGDYAPTCRQVERLSALKPGRTLVVAYYETVRTPGVARVRIDTTSSYEPALVEPGVDGRVIQGPDGDNIHEWRVTQGSAFTLTPRVKVIVETAFSEFNVNDVLDKVGHTNATTFTKLGNAAPDTMLLLGAPDTRYWREGDLWYINYAFEYNPDGWNSSVKVRKGANVAVQVPVLGFDQTLLAGKAPKVVDKFVFKTFTVDANGVVSTIAESPDAASRTLFLSSDFNELDGWIVW